MIRRLIFVVLLCSLSVSCSSTPAAESEEQVNLAAAEAHHTANPGDVDAIVWLGRRLGYVGRYEEAVDVFSRGLEQHPDNVWLLRFRGHRYITLRRFDLAVADLARAAKLVEGREDEIEPDGQPNAAGIPLTSLHSNIDYHLALANYLRGEYEQALVVLERGEERAQANPDRAVSHAYWMWLARMQLGQRAEARAELLKIDLAAPVIENDAYRDLLLLFRGSLNEREVLASHGRGTVQYATRGYGAAMARHFKGNRVGARESLQAVISAGPPGAFGVIAAESELARN